ncbi:MAG: glycoside hydrolase family 95-like protein [Phycisphaerae bacterium]
MISRANVHLPEANVGLDAGLPVGNGRMGSLVWTSPNSINLQINRVDVFSTTSNGSSLFHRHEDYCGGCGMVKIELGGEVFPDTRTAHDLDVYRAVATVKGPGASARTFVSSQDDVMVVELSGLANEAAAISIDLSALRPAVVQTLHHTAKSLVTARENRVGLVQEFSEADYFCTSAVAVAVVGRKAEASAVSDTIVRLNVAAGNGNFLVLIASGASFDRNSDVLAKAMASLDAASAKGLAGLRSATEESWAAFWAKSFVHLHGDDGQADEVERQYTLYLYDMASTSRGKYPPKFNGMLWTTQGDTRRWGSQYWWENTQPMYRGLIISNHMELMTPMLDMYSDMYAACEIAARQQWGTQGIMLSETMPFNGPEVLPDAIAAELRELMFDRKNWIDVTPEFKQYVESRHVHSSRWNWKRRDFLPYGTTTGMFSSGAKIAYLYWLRYQYTMDAQWLRDRAYPMLRGVAEFYRHYPNFRKAPDGKYHIRNVNNGEAVVGANDTIEELTAIRGMLSLATAAAEQLGTDTELRAAWAEVLENLAPLPTSEHPDAIMHNPSSAKTATFAEGLKPVHFQIVQPPMRVCQPCLHYDLWSLESDDPNLVKIANASLDASEHQKILKTPKGQCWLAETPAEAAKLGRAEDIRQTLPNACKPDRFLANMQGPEGNGAMSYALELALVQSAPAKPGGDPIIRLFPACPKEWAASFSLLCRGGFLVSSVSDQGQIKFVEITSQLGGTCRMRNPWPDATVIIKTDSGNPQEMTGSLLTLETSKGQRLRITPKP